MNKKPKSLGVKLSIFSSLMAFTLALIATVLTSISFASDTRYVTFSLVESGVTTAISSLNNKIEDLEYMGKAFTAHGMPTSGQQLTDWWAEARRYDYDSACIEFNGKQFWKTENYTLPVGYNEPKSYSGMYSLLEDKLEDAIRNAKRLIDNTILPSRNVPATNVYELVEELRNYLG